MGALDSQAPGPLEPHSAGGGVKDVGCVATAQKLWSNASLLEQYPQRKGFAKGAEMSSDERLAQVGRDSRRVSLLLRGEEGFPPSAHDRRIGHPATGRGFLQLKPTVPGLQKKRPAEWPYETPQKQKRLAPPVGQCQQLAEAPGPRGKRPLFCFKADESPPNLAVRCPGKPTHQQHHDLLCQTPLAAGQALATSEQRPPLKSISSPGTWQGQPHLAVQQDRSPQEVQDTPLPLSRQDEAEGDTPSVVEETPMPSSTSSTGARASIPPTPGTEEADMLLAACEQYEQASRPVSGPSPMPVKNLMNSALKPAKTTNPAAPQQNGFSEPLPANRSQGAMQNPEGYMNLQADPEVVAPNETAAEDKQIPGARDSSGDAGVESTIGRGPGAAGESNREVEEGELPLKLASYLPQQCLGPFGLPDGRLYQWQAECLHSDNVLGGGNLVYCAPTSGGKSLVAEVLMLRRLHRSGRPFLMVLPYVSLCDEKRAHLERLLAPLQREVRCFYGKHNGGTKLLGPSVGAIVATIEKANMLVNRLLEERTIDQLGAVVVDELHMVGEQGRGHTLELMLSKLCYHTQKGFKVEAKEHEVEEGQTADGIQIVGMSATMPNASRVAAWLDATLYETDFRPVELRKYVRRGWELLNERREVERHLPDPTGCQESRLGALCSEDPRCKTEGDLTLAVLADESVLKGESILIFRGQKALTVETAKMMSKVLEVPEPQVSEGEGAYTREQALDDLRGIKGKEATTLLETVARGVAFHNSDLTADLRKVVETAFKSGAVLVLVATPTMSTGVNLPAWRVVIRDPWIGRPTDWLTPGKCRQMCGRAGRKGLAERGEAILFPGPGSRDQEDKLYELLNGEDKPVTSCLLLDDADDVGMQLSMLEVVANGMVSTGQDVYDYLKSTLCFKLSEGDEEKENLVKSKIRAILQQKLERNGLIRWVKEEGGKGGIWAPTTLGKAAALSSMPPDKALRLKNDIEAAVRCLNLENDLHLVYLVVQGDEVQLKDDWQERIFVNVMQGLPNDQRRTAKLLGLKEPEVYLAAFQRTGRIISDRKDIAGRELARKFLSAKILFDLIEELPMEEIVERYSVKQNWRMELIKGTDLARLQESAGNMVGQVQAFCERMREVKPFWGMMAHWLGVMQGRIHSCVQQDILALTDIPGVQAKRARMLFKAKLRTPEDVARATTAEVAKALESGSKDGNRNPKLLFQIAGKVIQGAKKVVEQRAMELKEKAEEAMRAVHASQHAPESSKAAEPHRPIEVAAGDSTAKPDVPASVAQQNQARDGKSDLPLRVDGTDATLEELLSESRCAWRWCNGRGAEGVSLLEVWEGIQTAPGAWAFALDTSRAIEPGTTGPPEVVMPQLRGDIDTRSSSSSIAGPRGWALALPKPPASEAQGLLPSAVYYVPFQASGSCPGLVLWRAAMGSSAAAGRTASNSSSLKVTCDLKQQLLSLMQPGLGDAAATIGEQVVDVRIAEWVLQPDSTARVSDKLGPGSKKNHYLNLLKHRALEGDVAQLLASLSGSSPRWETVRKAACSLAIWHLQAPELERHKLREPMLSQEMPLVPLLARMEGLGIAIDRKALEEQCSGLRKTLEEMSGVAHAGARKKFSLSNPGAVSDVLFKELGIVPPPIAFEGVKKGRISTRSEVLELLIAMLADSASGTGEAADKSRRSLSVVRSILEHRKIAKLLEYFLKALSLAKQSSSRIHGQFLQTCCATGRLTMDEPNLQCVPKSRSFRELNSQAGSQDLTQHREAVANCRRGFVASEGFVLVGADYCQIELRIMAHLSKDPALLKMFEGNADPFRALASQWLGADVGSVTSEQRAHAKELAYAMIYGAGSFRLSEALGCTETEAAQLKDSFRLALPGLARWAAGVVEKCAQEGYVETIAGRRRYLPDIRSRDRGKRSRAERQAVNTVCQGSAADIAKLAMIRTTSELQEVAARSGHPAGRLLLQIHDELLMEVPEPDVLVAARAIRDAMAGAVHFDGVPLAVKIQSGRSWGELQLLELQP